MSATGARLHDGRRIDVGNTEGVQVAHQAARILKAKARMELQPICGKRTRAAFFRRQAIQAFRDAARFGGQYRWIGSHGGDQTVTSLETETPKQLRCTNRG